jgi:hypothetical protein
MTFARTRIAAALAPVLIGGTAALAGTASAAPAAHGQASQPQAVRVAAAAAAPAPAAAATVVVSCLGQGQVRPTGFVLTCADANDYLSKLTWAAWGSTAAFATGTEWMNDCVPSCARGHFHSYAVLAVLWRAAPRPGHAGEQHYTRLTIIYRGSRPAAFPVTRTLDLWSSILR